jgi:hypothetical protein
VVYNDSRNHAVAKGTACFLSARQSCSGSAQLSCGRKCSVSLDAPQYFSDSLPRDTGHKQCWQARISIQNTSFVSRSMILLFRVKGISPSERGCTSQPKRTNTDANTDALRPGSLQGTAAVL